MFCLSFLELASIGLILPYIDIASNASNNSSVIKEVLSIFKLDLSRNEILIAGGFLLIALFIIKSIFSVLIKKSIISFCHEVLAELRYRLTSTYLNQSFPSYSSRNSSEYIHSIQAMSNHYAGSILRPSLMLFSELFIAMTMLIYAGLLFPFEFFILIIFCIIPFLIYSKITARSVKIHGQEANKFQMKMINSLTQSIKGFKEINILNNHSFFEDSIKQSASKFAYHDTIPRVYGVIPRYLIETILIIFIVFNVFFIIFTDGNLTELVPMLVIFAVISIKLIPVFALLMTTLNEFRFLRDSVSRLYKDYKNYDDNKILNDNNKNHAKYSNKYLESVSFLDINFNYPGSKDNTLKDITLEFKKNIIVGLVGKSGSGKSTLVDIFLGFLKPSSGKLLINNDPSIDINKYMKIHAHYIPQTVSLNDSSIMENIAYGIRNEDIDISKVNNAIISASLNEYVKTLPAGIHSLVGENGENLSGGQRQRIALARAFYHNRDILVLDESTSALDKNTEEEIINEINLLKGIKTIIIISHNPKVLSICDKVFHLDNGSLKTSS